MIHCGAHTGAASTLHDMNSAQTGLPQAPRRAVRYSFWIGVAAMVLLAGTALRLIWSTELGRELLAKSFMTLTGYLATPFVLETSFFVLGWVLVLTWNEHRRRREGPEWVEMSLEAEGDAPAGTSAPQPSDTASPRPPLV